MNELINLHWAAFVCNWSLGRKCCCKSKTGIHLAPKIQLTFNCAFIPQTNYLTGSPVLACPVCIQSKGYYLFEFLFLWLSLCASSPDIGPSAVWARELVPCGAWFIAGGSLLQERCERGKILYLSFCALHSLVFKPQDLDHDKVLKMRRDQAGLLLHAACNKSPLSCTILCHKMHRNSKGCKEWWK